MESNKQKVIYDYYCDKCDRGYTSYQSLWNHNKKKHKTVIPLNTSQTTVLNSNTTHSNSVKYLNCSYCNKTFTRKDNLNRHIKICKSKEEYDIKNAKLEEIRLAEIRLKQINAENKNLELQIKMVKLNNNIAGKIITKNSNNTNNGTIAGTINNTFVKYNNICYNNVLTKKDMKEIVSDFETALEKAIQKFHFNEKFPENNNIYITNLRDKLMYVFDGIQFMAIDKKEAIYELMDCHACEIYNYVKKDKVLLDKYNKLMFDIFKSTKKYVDENNQVFKNYNDYKTDKIKKLIYNSSNKKKFEEIKSMDKLFEKPDIVDNDVVI
jgi:hypothetical protein